MPDSLLETMVLDMINIILRQVHCSKSSHQRVIRIRVISECKFKSISLNHSSGEHTCALEGLMKLETVHLWGSPDLLLSLWDCEAHWKKMSASLYQEFYRSRHLFPLWRVAQSQYPRHPNGWKSGSTVVPLFQLSANNFYKLESRVWDLGIPPDTYYRDSQCSTNIGKENWWVGGSQNLELVEGLKISGSVRSDKASTKRPVLKPSQAKNRKKEKKTIADPHS